jgi:hypothetical protein
MQVFAQDTFINDLRLNPFLIEITLLANMINTLSSPFSPYTNNSYSSYDPFALPYTTIPDSPDYNPLPYPFVFSNPTSTNFLYKTYDDYNPVSFLNSGYPDFSITALFFPTITESINSNLLSQSFQPGLAGVYAPLVPPGLFPGLIPNLFFL